MRVEVVLLLGECGEALRPLPDPSCPSVRHRTPTSAGFGLWGAVQNGAEPSLDYLLDALVGPIKVPPYARKDSDPAAPGSNSRRRGTAGER